MNSGSDFESDEQEWEELANVEAPMITIQIPMENPIEISNGKKATSRDKFDIPDKKLRHDCICVLLSCIIVHFVSKKSSLLHSTRNDEKCILKMNYKKLDFKIFYRNQHCMYASCICDYVNTQFCMFCSMRKNADYKIHGTSAKIVRIIESDCFILSADSSFGFTNITDSILPFCPSRLKFKNHLQLLSWLYSSGQSTKRAIMRMPTNLKGFKDHPFYCLKKSLNYNQILDIPVGEERKLSIGIYKKELVYPTNLIKELYSERELLKMGLKLKMGQDCVKIGSGRKLYGKWQCIPLDRPLLVDGKIPTDSYGSIELLHRNMLPLGCTVLDDGCINACKFLDVQFVKILSGFRGKVPYYSGIVVMEEYLPIIIEVKLALDEIENESAKVEKEILVYGRWKAMITAYTLKKRLEADYL